MDIVFIKSILNEKIVVFIDKRLTAAYYLNRNGEVTYFPIFEFDTILTIEDILNDTKDLNV